MKKIICPFCQGTDPEFIDDVKIAESEETKPLYKCTNYRGFFWGDTRGRVHLLSDMCTKRFFSPDDCQEEILIHHAQHELGPSSLDVIKEMDLICSACKEKNFIFRRK